ISCEPKPVARCSRLEARSGRKLAGRIRRFMALLGFFYLPRNKHANIALTYIYGIGDSRAARILDAAKVDPMKKVSDLAEDEVNRIRQVIEAEGRSEEHTSELQ